MKTRLLVTGAAGFLGGRTAKYFAGNDSFSVLAVSRRSDRLAELEKSGCDFRSGDLLDIVHCNEITKGIDTIVHCAALSSPWGNIEAFTQANVVATQNLFTAALQNKVKRFALISTPSIYFNYEDRYLVKENDPLPARMVNYYAATKLEAEKIILSGNGKTIQTIALRPRAIIGAEDTVIFPRLLRAYREGRLKVIGNGDNNCDLTCARNVIAAIECSLDADESAMGQAYNISDGAPVNLWNKINHLLQELDMQPVTKKIPETIALAFAALIEQQYKWLRKKTEPPITKYGLATLSKSLTMDISAAKKNLNYKPVQTTDEGINEFIQWYKTKHLS